MTYPAYPQYKIKTEWIVDGKWYDCYFIQMFKAERTCAEITAEIREQWWPEFIKPFELEGKLFKGPYFTVVFHEEDTWCDGQGFYWTFDTGCSDEELLASWEDYRDRWGIQDDVELHRCEFCEALGIVRMTVTRSGRFDDPA